MSNKKRKEVVLADSVILALEAKAKNDGRSLKNYMEKILNEAAKK